VGVGDASIEWRRPGPGLTSWDGLALTGFAAVAGARIVAGAPDLLALVPRCPFLHLTGFPCATCGFTRAFVRTASLDLGGALAVSPLGTAVILACAILAGWVALARAFPMRIRLPIVRPRSPALRVLRRFGIPLAFLLNWAYLIAVTWIAGAPPA